LVMILQGDAAFHSNTYQVAFWTPESGTPLLLLQDPIDVDIHLFIVETHKSLNSS
jgi:hypothetical protein